MNFAILVSSTITYQQGNSWTVLEEEDTIITYNELQSHYSSRHIDTTSTDNRKDAFSEIFPY